MSYNQLIITIISILLLLLPLAFHGLATANTTNATTATYDRDHDRDDRYRDRDDRYRDRDDRYRDRDDRYRDRDRDRAIRNGKTANVVVEGKVYCQTCKYYGPWSLAALSAAEPIRAARVRVVCKNYRRRVSYYDTFKTDRNGYFYAELKDFRMSHLLLDHPLHACSVKLVSSPHERCNLASNLNNGINGAPLRFENKVLYGGNYETVVYAAGPLAFRLSDCYPGIGADANADAEATDP